MRTLKDLLVSRGELDRLYIGHLNVSLWRALHRDVATSNPLYPDFASREVRGVLRAPDVEINGDLVVARLGEGTSLFDKNG
jgi:hypothetical protein